MIGELEIIVGTDESEPVANLDHNEWDAFEARAREVLLRAWRHGACPVGEAESFELLGVDGRGRSMFERLGLLLDTIEALCEAAEKGRAA